MPSKFSCRKLREAGQRFESFLAERGLDLETDRERLRMIYNRDFKPRYGPAHHGPQGAGLAPGRWGHLPAEGATRMQPGADGASPVLADQILRLPTPSQRNPEPARFAQPGPPGRGRCPRAARRGQG